MCNNFLKKWVNTCFLLKRYLGEEFLRYMVSVWTFSKKLWNSLLKWLYCFTYPPAMSEYSNYSTILLTLNVIMLFNFSPLSRGGSGINCICFMTKNVKHLYIRILASPLVKFLFMYFVHFNCVVFLLLSYEFFFFF